MRGLEDLKAKCRLVDWIIKNKKKSDYIFGSEVMFSQDRRFADLVLLKNHESVAYEVKSEKDTLIRLSMQLHSYLETFNYAYVFCAANHLNGVLEIAPSNVGIIVETSKGIIRYHRRARKTTKLNPKSMLFGFKLADVRECVINQFGWNFGKVTKEKIISHYTTKEINCIFFSLLQNKYKKPTLSFMKERGINTCPDDLLIISRIGRFNQKLC